MDIYSKKSRWKLHLALAAVVIAGISMIYTSSLASRVAKGERQRVQQWANAIREMSNSECENLSFYLDIISQNYIPAILTDENDNIVSSVNLEMPNFIEKEEDKLFLKNKLREYKKNGNEAILVKTKYYQQYVYYENSFLLKLLNYFPYFQLGIIGSLFLAGYLAFSAARKSEQNLVWVGLAKETAHQLGTPISAIVAWIEYLKSTGSDITHEEMEMVTEEMDKDIKRLELVAERFSKIGAIPKLEIINLYDIVDKSMRYMKKRAPRRVEFVPLTEEDDKQLAASINPSLFSWVLENLLKNALDAMDGKGKISAEFFEDKDYVYIDISDTGKGIPSSKFNTVFQPGFTTKKRGWGLGLSLTKRIVETYHSGKIFVKESLINEGTTFRIQLPRKK